LRMLDIQGWDVAPFGLFAGSLAASAERGPDRLGIYYQCVPPGLSHKSSYPAVQTGHSLAAGYLLPDVTLHLRRGREERWLLIEMKSGDIGGPKLARRALRDLFMYRTAFASTLTRQTDLYGLGIAWGSELLPHIHEGVSLCTPDHIGDALSLAFGHWSSLSTS
jgi:hypothetical protein